MYVLLFYFSNICPSTALLFYIATLLLLLLLFFLQSLSLTWVFCWRLFTCHPYIFANSGCMSEQRNTDKTFKVQNGFNSRQKTKKSSRWLHFENPFYYFMHESRISIAASINQKQWGCRPFLAVGAENIAQQSDMIKIYKSSPPPAAWLVAVPRTCLTNGMGPTHLHRHRFKTPCSTWQHCSLLFVL